jgi:adenosylhomocysteine nucleosidase
LGLSPDFVVLISADAEWRALDIISPDSHIFSSPYGNWFAYRYPDAPRLFKPIVFFHGGWGKVAAAGSTQYVINHWQPKLIVNLGTCGGFEGEITRGEIILVEKTIIYDIYEQMGDPEEHIMHYLTEIDNSWISEPYPHQVVRSRLVSGDRDLFCEELPELKSKYGAIAGDWESGAIAWVAAKNRTQCLI